MTTQLSLYNRALRHLGERTLASLTENVESRRALDAAYSDGFLKYCLEQGQWNFAIRTVELGSSPDVETEFGYRYAFDVPTDWIRSVGVCSDEYFIEPLIRVSMEGEYWYADIDPIFVRYVSNDSAFGGDFSLWPQSFTKWAALHLADEVCSALTASETKIARIKQDVKKALTDARSKDAMNESAGFLPTGAWVRARGGQYSRRDRGSRSNLIG